MNYPDDEEQCQKILNQLQQDINNLIKSVEDKLQTQEVDLRDEDIQAELAKQINSYLAPYELTRSAKTRKIRHDLKFHPK